ncbi:zf-TFIIB domain-containing protein [Streptomyces sp. NPDC059037]|uniref:TFIIB-type zinc ribbon-containing protein n=1 Tax=Streptomyces sp. NPDC059037 TaxID=3346710 RepID=UPI00369C42EB
MQCPKCHAPMHTYNRNGVQIEQCSGCRGIFLDYGELEALSRVESQWGGQQAPPPPPAPQAYPAAPAPQWGVPQHGGQHGGHGGHYGHNKRHKSFGHMLFSS